MKISLFFIVLPFASAFVLQKTPTQHSFAYTLNAVTLEPEPDGGDEIRPLKSVPGCRMKQLQELKNIKSENGPAYQFWMTSTVDGSMIKEYHLELLKNAKKKANFPGFRKVREKVCLVSCSFHITYLTRSVSTGPSTSLRDSSNYSIFCSRSNHQDGGSCCRRIWTQIAARK